MGGLGPDNFQEAKEAWKKQDQWRQESAERYEEKLREEHDSKFRHIGSNEERRGDEFNRAYGGEERASFVRDMECAVPGCHAPSENAHLPGAGGMGYKGDADTVCNLCPAHHRTHPQSLHNLGSVERFKEEWGVFLPDVAEEVERKWRERDHE